MASITAKVVGGEKKIINVATVAEAKTAMGVASNYTATVNGTSRQGDHQLAEDDFLALTPAVKGGASN